MEWKLRPFSAAASVAVLVLGVSVASSVAHAEARQVGGNKATWDKACQKSKDCMPFGDVGNGRNGYFVHDGNGGGTSVWCTDTKCAADRQIKPSKEAVQILEQPASQIGGAIGGKQATGNESPSMLLNMR